MKPNDNNQIDKDLKENVEEIDENQVVILNSLDVIEENAENSFKLLTTYSEKGDKYFIAGYDVILDQISQMNEFLSQREYTDEEEKLYKQIRAKINKVKGSLTSLVNQTIKYHFDLVKTQSKEIQSQLDDTVRLLNDNINKSIEKMKAVKMQDLEETYQSIVLYKSDFADLELKDFFNQKWLNKSYSLTKARDELIHRIETYEYLVKTLNDDKKIDAEKLVEFKNTFKMITLLSRSNWDVIKFINNYGDAFIIKPEEPENKDLNTDENVDNTQISNEGGDQNANTSDDNLNDSSSDQSRLEKTIKLEIEVPLSKYANLMTYLKDNGIAIKLIE